MSIIQSIRDKAAWLVFGVIALSLLGFLLMDAFVGRGSRGGLFGGNETTIGKVNGEAIDYIDFQKRAKMMEDQYAAQGYPMNEMMRQNLTEQLWNQTIEETVLREEAAKLGLSVTPKELEDILFGANPPQDLAQQFTNAQGVYDANAARAAIAELRKQKNNPNAENFENVYLPELMKSRLREKYMSLLANTLYYPKWMLEKMNNDNSQLAAISYVNAPYAAISDSSIKVTDEDINAYVSKHKEDFKQEKTRGISYVIFNAAPTAADTAATAASLLALKNEFVSTNDAAAFVVRNGSGMNYYDGYTLKNKMAMQQADSIRSLADGAVYGPYLDGNAYVMAKMVGRRNMPDSAKVRHILIGTQSAPDSIGKKRIDSIAAAIQGGASFAELCARYSDDQGSKTNGGEYTFGSTQFGTLAREFAEVSFYGATGDKKVVKTDFGYHYIEVLNQQNFEPAYKVAYMSKPILPSTETENNASGLANQFAGESRTAKAFDENAKKKNYNKLIAADIRATDAMIPGLGSSRPLVRWVYENKVGSVSEPFNVDDKFVVAAVTEVNEEGTMSAAKARPTVEFLVRNQKKAAEIKKKIGTASTLEAISAAVGQPIFNADSVSFASPFIPNAGQEGKVVGASFNKANQGKVSAPISGNSGVFVIRVNNVTAQPNAGANVQVQQEQLFQQARNQAGFRSMEGLRKSAKVDDKRGKFL
jgi:peptidyl-prolyl cis-trans isomerase D